jgi:hypothetical protein
MRQRGRGRGRGIDEQGHEQELEVPIICARKVETTPVPDLNAEWKKERSQRLDGGGVEDGTRPISRQSRGARERMASASASSASKRMNVSSVSQTQTNQLSNCWVQCPSPAGS